MSNERLQLEEENTKLDLLRYVRTVWRRRLFIILPVLFVTSITFVGVRFMSPLYVSRSRIDLEKRAKVTRELERQIVDESGGRVRKKDELENVKNQITSREFLEGIVRELGLHSDPEIMARAQLLHDTRTPDVPAEEIAMRNLIRGLRQKLNVKHAGLNSYQISVFDNDAENAYLLAKVITRSFVDEVKRQRMEKLSELFKFSSRQSQIYRDRLEEAERGLRDYQAALVQERGKGSPVTLQNYNQAKSYQRRLQLDADQAAQRLATMRVALAQDFDPIPNIDALASDATVSEMVRRLHVESEDALLLDLERLGSTTAPLDPEALVDGTSRVGLRDRLRRLVALRYERIDESYQTRIVEYAFEKILVDVERERVASLAQKINRYEEKLAEKPDEELQLKILQQKVVAAQRSLDTFQNTVQSAELSETIMATQLAGGVSIVDPPEKPVSPLRPNKKRLVSLAFLVGLIGGLFSIFAVEYLDKSFKEIAEVERILALHVVGTLPRVELGMHFGPMPVNRKRRWLLASSIALLFLMLGSMALYEKLLRKQRVAVPAAAAEAILQRDDATRDNSAAPQTSAGTEEDTWPALLPAEPSGESN